MAEAAGIAASALEFLKVASTCLSTFQEIKMNTPESQRILSFRLEAETLKFGEWCAVLGIQDMVTSSKPGEWSGSPAFPQFQDRLRTMLRFDNERMAEMTIQALQDMELIFQKARVKLISSASEPPRPRFTKRIPLFRSRKAPGTGTKIASVATNGGNSSLDLRSRASGLFANVKWLAYDQKLFLHLLNDIAAINACLGTFLSESARAKIDRRVQTNMLRNPKLHSDPVEEFLPENSEVRKLAKIQLEVEREERQTNSTDGKNGNISTQNERSTITKPPILDISDFKPGTLGFGPLRSLSFSNGPVLVEWTQYGKSIQLDHFYRRGHLLSLLNDEDLFRKFKTLRPRGVVVDSKNSRIGLVFELPKDLDPPSQERTLRGMLEAPPRPLGQKFAMAQTLANAFFSLQSVNWLHKSIRSDNILYFEQLDRASDLQPTSSHNTEIGDPANQATIVPNDGLDGDDQQSKAANVESLIAGPSPLPELYLLGWNLSRPDHPSELSESISISTQGYKLTKELVRLYSHPDILLSAASGSPVRFKLEYDVYSFGLILLEIGLWTTLSFLRARCSSDDEFRRKASQEYCDMLMPRMGETYWRVTKRCLCNTFDRKFPTGLTLAEREEEQPLSVAFERQVVSELENCSV